MEPNRRLITWMLIVCANVGAISCSSFSFPRYLLLGPKGVGKSSLGNVLAGCQPNDQGQENALAGCQPSHQSQGNALAGCQPSHQNQGNALAGCQPNDESCPFPVCRSGPGRCTNHTNIAQVSYLGNGADATVVDTPGFGGSDAVEDVVKVLRETLEESNVTVLCLEYTNGPLDSTVQKTILELESWFGRGRFWDNVIVEVTKWAFDPVSIRSRQIQGVTEESALLDINQKLDTTFHVNRSIPGVFLDSFATYFPEDQVQQEYFNLYATQLWNFAKDKDALSFLTVEDALEKYDTCREENECLDGFIDGKITEIEQKYSRDVTEFECPVGDTNKLGENVCTSNAILVEHAKDIEVIKDDLNHHDDINQQQTNQIAKNEEDIASLSEDLIHKVDRIIEFSKCRNSAEQELGNSYGSNARYVGNCDSGDLLTPSDCRFECWDEGSEVYRTCGQVQCGLGRWEFTAGRMCCKGHHQLYGCCD